MFNSSSYRTKRRRINNELLALESSDDDDNELNTQNVTDTFVLNSIESSKISHNNFQQQPLIPVWEENILEVIGSTQSTLINSIENTNSNLQGDVNESLKKWATDFNIPQNALNALLKVLKYDAGL